MKGGMIGFSKLKEHNNNHHATRKVQPDMECLLRPSERHDEGYDDE